MAPGSVLHEDADVLVVDKPPGQLVIPGREDSPGGEPAQPTVKEAWERAGAGPLWVVHRLDRGTSGVLVFARTPEAHRQLSQAFEGRTVEKTYWALCKGLLYGHGEIDRPLLPIRGGLVRALAPTDKDPRAKPSRTAWRAAERWRDFTQVEARPRTGRLHQIRAHLASLGHPLAVDPSYGGAAQLRLGDVGPTPLEPSAGSAADVVLARVPLHAQRLVLPHPRTGTLLSLAAPLPPDLARVVELLRRAAG